MSTERLHSYIGIGIAGASAVIGTIVSDALGVCIFLAGLAIAAWLMGLWD